jgi:hypothetical protein
MYNYVPETNHIFRANSFESILWMHFTVHIMLFPMLNVLHFYTNTF